MQLDDASIAKIVATLGAAERPVTLDKVRLERELRQLALDHAEGRISVEAYLTRLGELKGRLAAIR